MCPGGFIVPAATANGEVVVNGMSPSKRNNQFANSGIVVEINADEDLKKYEHFGALKGLEFQKDFEKFAFVAGRQTVHVFKRYLIPARIKIVTYAFFNA